MKYLFTAFLLSFMNVSHSDTGFLEYLYKSSSHAKATEKVFDSNVLEEQRKGIQHLKKEVKEGSYYAMGKLGWAYQLGIGVEKDLPKALNLYEKAADAGMTYWQILLAHAYQQGYFGLEKSPEKHLYWANHSNKIHNANYTCWVSDYYKNNIFPANEKISMKYDAKCKSLDSSIHD